MKTVLRGRLALLASLCVSAPAAGQDAYNIPPGLIPMWTWRDGYSAEESLRYRRAYDGGSLTEAGDVGAYAVVHISEVLPTAMVGRDGPVAPLERLPMPEIAEVTATTSLGTMTLREVMDDPRSRMRAIAVIHEGKLVFEEYIGIRPVDTHVWASATKTVPGLIAHQLEDEGLLDLSEPIGSYLEELQETAWAEIPVADVLHHRSGLDVREASLGVPGHPTTRFYATFAGAAGADESFLASLQAAGKLREPGQLFEYSSLNTYAIVLLVERITGQAFHDVFTERIWSKVGMEGDGLLGLSPSGEPSAFGIYASRLRDFARYGMLYTPSWRVVADERLVSESYLPEVYAAADPEVFAGSDMGDRLLRDFDESSMGASYQWDAVFEDGDLYKSGRSGQALYISPETDTVVVWFSSTYQNTLWVHAYAREIVKSLFR
jgi:CubicO group peptidase (beta-lactamase class C family)